MLECPDVVGEGSLSSRQHPIDILTIRLLTKCDIRKVTPFIAYLYGAEFNTAWKKEKHLVLDFYENHRGQISLWMMRKFNKIVHNFIERLDQLKGPAYAPLPMDAATSQSLTALANKLEKLKSGGVLERFYTTSPTDILNSNTIQLGVLNKIHEIDLARTIVDYQYKKLLASGDYHWAGATRSSELVNGNLKATCFDTISSILCAASFGRQCVCDVVINYQEIGELLDVLYKLSIPKEFLKYPFDIDNDNFDSLVRWNLRDDKMNAYGNEAMWYQKLTNEEALLIGNLKDISYHVYDKTHVHTLVAGKDNLDAYRYLLLKNI